MDWAQKYSYLCTNQARPPKTLDILYWLLSADYRDTGQTIVCVDIAQVVA